MKLNAKERKAIPIFSGVLKYFPLAIAEIARVSLAGNEQHHPGQPLHWDKNKSTDELDALTRHLMDAGTFDTDGQRHSAKVAWRALANLERELEATDTTHILPPQPHEFLSAVTTPGASVSSVYVQGFQRGNHTTSSQ